MLGYYCNFESVEEELFKFLSTPLLQIVRGGVGGGFTTSISSQVGEGGGRFDLTYLGVTSLDLELPLN